jgi:xanthine dehydrogenase accessory factor
MAERGAEVLGEAALSLRSHGRVALCQIVRTEGSTPGKVGWKLLVRPDGTYFGNLGGGAFEAMVKADALRLLVGGELSPQEPEPGGAATVAGAPGGAPGAVGGGLGGGGGHATGGVVKRYYLTEQAVRGQATGMVCGGMADVFLEVIAAAPVLVICGGGPVGQALARAAGPAAFEVLVADDREAWRRPELFPPGTLLAAVDRDYSEDFLAPVTGRDLYVAVVSRCWETDVSALAAVLRLAPPRLRYLGLMGSRRKLARVNAELAQRGADLGARRLHAPIGLRLGGDSPGEIAISILAEVIGVRYETPQAT